MDTIFCIDINKAKPVAIKVFNTEKRINSLKREIDIMMKWPLKFNKIGNYDNSIYFLENYIKIIIKI